ncbi:DUF4126 domain-containing protein [Sphingomonas sp. AR_OL41]|uniref:DUF4126 domain-containing protein n=1 Tax=Sphingomonas sp. AR_OL41 TaxID=3042729 RepID=UPI0024810B6B|nr:DUF4126 domain-containing protein [Sphingomonas sp. AR_OL41]MDH7974104.1 DUF4126 domain-containing protein [Sphingomonas sp. AR_OL41]
MGVLALLGLASSISLLSGWRLYLCVFATGLAMRFGWIVAPAHLTGLDALASPWVLAIAGVGMVAEFFADKVAWLDSVWDAIHTLVRPVGGALLALAIIDPHDMRWQVASLLLGGSAALLSHGAKASTRAVVNVSPEPFSNVIVSTGEDVVATGLLAAAIASPVAAVAIAILLATGAVAMLVLLRRLYRRMRRRPAHVQ